MTHVKTKKDVFRKVGYTKADIETNDPVYDRWNRPSKEAIKDTLLEYADLGLILEDSVDVIAADLYAMYSMTLEKK